jgi:hypothetical protein
MNSFVTSKCDIRITIKWKQPEEDLAELILESDSDPHSPENRDIS